MDALLARVRVQVENGFPIHHDDAAELLTAYATVQADARDFRLRVLDAVGPCAPEEDGAASLPDVIRRIRAERDAAEERAQTMRNNGLAASLLLTENERLTTELATLRERLAGEVEALFAQDGDDWSSGLNTGLDRAITIIKGTK